MLLMLLAKLEGATVLTSDPMAGRRNASLRFGAAESFDPVNSGTCATNCAVALMAAAPMRFCSLCRIPRSVGEALAIARPGGRVLCSRTTIR